VEGADHVTVHLPGVGMLDDVLCTGKRTDQASKNTETSTHRDRDRSCSAQETRTAVGKGIWWTLGWQTE
jgi:hypothetical protein